jgi:hypothetical protein
MGFSCGRAQDGVKPCRSMASPNIAPRITLWIRLRFDDNANRDTTPFSRNCVDGRLLLPSLQLGVCPAGPLRQRGVDAPHDLPVQPELVISHLLGNGVVVVQIPLFS